jgi:hypothetical protein
MAAEDNALKTQRTSFRGESMYIWEGLDSQHHLSDTESKYGVLSFLLVEFRLLRYYTEVPKSHFTPSFTIDIPYIRQKKPAFFRQYLKAFRTGA